MTTLKDTLFSRGAKACFAVLLAASLVPASALSSTTAFAEDVEDDAAALVSEENESQPTARDADVDADNDTDATAPVETPKPAAPAAEDDAEDPTEDATDDQREPEEGTAVDANEAAATEQATDEPIVEVADGSVTDIQIESLETTVETEEPFSFFSPLRLLFGAASDGFTVPLKRDNYERWIDRLDLSGAIDGNGTNYAQTFYNILVEASDNDNTADWLIDWGNPVVLNRNGHVGGVYQVPNQPSGTIGILATIISNNEPTNGSSALTATEQRVKEYINETYGAFDRDYPTSFWRDIQFGTVFWRPSGTTQSYCLFVLRAPMSTYTMDIRAQGYRTPTDIRKAITAMDEDVAAIKAAYQKDDLAKLNSDYSRVKFYNDWLCENNQYNTAYPNIDQAANPDVWSARSALEGRKGNVGPVCEGYARAMKVLCDSDGIGCVLVDGKTEPGAHMWNYVRMGSQWYGVDVTWNDSGAGATSSDYDEYLLKGSQPFETTHPPSNQFVSDGTKFTNGPQLATEDYDASSVTFAGAITGLGPFAYGDEFPLAYNSTTEGDVTYQVVSGPATKYDAASVAEAAATGARSLLRITGTGAITVKVTLTTEPAEGSAESGKVLTDTITITAGPRPLKTTGTVLATKVYDGGVAASVTTPGTLVSARTEPSYAANVGVLDADKDDITASLKADSAAFLAANAGTARPAVATYELTSPTNNADKLKLYTLEGFETENTTGTIAKRPVTAYFALTSTRVFTKDALPGGTVRFEPASGMRGKLAEDDLQPPAANIRTTGMPSSMPTDIAPGSSRTYNVTWAMPNTSVLTEIAKNPTSANYDVELSTDTALNTVPLVIVNAENMEVLPGDSPSNSGAQYRVECRIDGINEETLEALKDSGYADEEAIRAKLVEELGKKTTKSLAASRMTVYDMTLYVKDDKEAWVLADEDNFPDEGVRVTVPYPANTSGTTHSFYAAHMFTHKVTSGGAEHNPGEVETPTVLNGTDGVFFTLMGFSPVSVAWEDVPGQITDPTDGNTSQVSQNNRQVGASAVGQTGDSLPVLGITVVALACIVLIVALAVRRKRDKNGEQE